ncbi:MerR family transcriptional regulator [Flavisolibacter nicotianae]|uniref:MerR family transcriptional regulator n=1 Tax=Flavisolibacter nicotianae TaxID=2364882 RepID=UPI000EB2D477|nr:MerR family transcriptional regulator [Flavisolibacter nicotianae]
MQSFSIRQIELLTGIKSHTLRIWELRYDFFKAPRKESNLRFYTNDDLKKLLCISFLYHNGWKISKIASLSDAEVITEVENIPVDKNNYPTAIQHLLKAAIDFDESAFLSILNELQAKIGFEKLVTEVCYPYLVRIGLLWDTSKVIPAQEHFSSYLIQNRVISETETLSAMQNGDPELVLFCPENEFHELPLLFINYLLRKNGWRVLYLGSNSKLEDLREAANVPGVRYLYLHLITNFTGVSLDDYFELLRKSFPDKIIVASGKSLQQSQRSFVNFRLLRRDDEIYVFAEKGKA